MSYNEQLGDPHQPEQQLALACEIHGTDLQNLKGMHSDARVIMIDARNNAIESLYGMPSLPGLQCLRLEFNRLESFLGMSYQPALQVLCLTGNPVCDIPHYRILAMLACGESLREIDGDVVTDEERHIFEQLGGSGGIMAQLVSLGWCSLGLDGETDENWVLEKCKANFLAVSQAIDEQRSFGAIAPHAANLVPLDAEPAEGRGALATGIGGEPYRSVLSPPRGLTRHALNPTTRRVSPQAEHERLHRELREHDRAAAQALSVADRKPASANVREQQQLFRPEEVEAFMQQPSESSSLTMRDVNSVLRAQAPNFPEQQQQHHQPVADGSSSSAAFAAQQLIMQTRAHELFAHAKLDPKKAPLEQARELAKVYRAVGGVNGGGAAVASSSAVATAAATGAESSGPSPVSAMGGSASPAGATTRISGAQLMLLRDDVVCFDSIQMRGAFDVSASFQAPKVGSLQVVRASIRIRFAFDATSAAGEQLAQAPSLEVLDDAGEIVASFALPISHMHRPQSLWIHGGNPPAVALCTEQDGGVLDIVIMPSAGTPNAEATAHALHKTLIHAMAEHRPSNGALSGAAASPAAAATATVPAAVAPNKSAQPSPSPTRPGTLQEL